MAGAAPTHACTALLTIGASRVAPHDRTLPGKGAGPLCNGAKCFEFEAARLLCILILSQIHARRFAAPNLAAEQIPFMNNQLCQLLR